MSYGGSEVPDEIEDGYTSSSISVTCHGEVRIAVTCSRIMLQLRELENVFIDRST